MAHRGPPRADRGAARRLRLRRRPRPGRAAHRPRGLSGAGPRGVRRAGTGRHLRRFPPRSDADGAGTQSAAGTGGSRRVVRLRPLSRPADQRRPAHPAPLRRRTWRAHRRFGAIAWSRRGADDTGASVPDGGRTAPGPARGGCRLGACNRRADLGGRLRRGVQIRPSAGGRCCRASTPSGWCTSAR